jgi:ADP-heptose:LPS heptosyltransferase
VQALAARPRRIAVFRALQLGDLLCAVPALRALRTAAPRAQITLVGLPGARDFTQRFRAYVDEHLPFPGAAGFPEQAPREAEWPAFLAAVGARAFDLAIQMHGSGELSNPIVARFGARHVAGFRPRVALPMPVDDGNFMIWPETGSEVSRLLLLMEFLGAPTGDASLELPVFDSERREWQQLATRYGLVPGRFVCIHPGVRLASRRWPVERFARVCAHVERQGLRIVLTGSADERPLVAKLAAALKAQRIHAVDLAGRTTLGVLASALRDCRLLVCNDTGVSHVAAAVGTKSVVIASGSDTRRWAPADRVRHRVLAFDVPCRPCSHAECPIGHPCALGVTVEHVIDVARAQLAVAQDFASHAA